MEINNKHYNWDLKIDTIEVIEEIIKGQAGIEAFYLGNVAKYIIRADKKNGLEDYKKAYDYLGRFLIRKMKKNEENK